MGIVDSPLMRCYRASSELRFSCMHFKKWTRCEKDTKAFLSLPSFISFQMIVNLLMVTLPARVPLLYFSPTRIIDLITGLYLTLN